MTDFNKNSLPKALGDHWYALARLITTSENMTKHDVVAHLRLIERNLCNKVMPLVDNNLAYQK